MGQSIDEILGDLRSFVAGRGREDNFLYSKASGNTRCVDFSRWLGLRLAKNDTLAIAVYKAQLIGNEELFGASVTFSLSDDGKDIEIGEVEEDDDIHPKSFEREVNRHEQEIKHILQFPFEEYFENDIRLAKFDLLLAWLLGYSGEQFAKAMMPYHLRLKNAKTYLDEHNRRRKKQFQLPADLPNNDVFNEFQRELGKLPLASRLHVFDILEYSGFRKKQKQKLLSEMTLYGTRGVGIDEKQSADILRQSKLITSSPDGTGFVAPEYVGPISIALDYTKKISPVYYEWGIDVGSLISDQLGVYFYDNDDPSNDGYVGSEEFEE